MVLHQWSRWGLRHLIALAMAACTSRTGAPPSRCEAAGGGAQAVSDFYRGKTITIVVGFAPGGGFDTTARVLSRHLPNHIPGNPNIVVDNMEGAGSLIAANHLSSDSQSPSRFWGSPSPSSWSPFST